MAGLIGQLITLFKHTQGGPTQTGPIGYFPAYLPPAYRPPRTDNEAQKLYNHARVVAYYLDAMPIPGGKLPFGVGIDSIIGFIPFFIGDAIGFILGCYLVFLASLYGLPPQVLGMMIVNVFADALIGSIPIIGSFLDVAFRANLRNLAALEAQLVSTKGTCDAGTFTLTFPPSGDFNPGPEPVGVGVRSDSSGWRRTRPVAAAFGTGAGADQPRASRRSAGRAWGSRN